LAVDEGPVGGAKVFQHIVAGLEGQPGMPAGDLRVVNEDVISNVPTDIEFAFFQRERFAGSWPSFHNELIRLVSHGFLLENPQAYEFIEAYRNRLPMEIGCL
jgi:hypothetical protein